MHPTSGYDIPEGSIEARFRVLDTQRQAKLDRARRCASLTVPELLPPEGWSEENQLPMPYSATAGRGVVGLASRMLSAMLPLNDSPFFHFGLADGSDPAPEANDYLETLSYQVYRRLSNNNLRDSLYLALQHLIAVGDVLFIMEDDFSYRTVRADQFVVRRSVEGKVQEIIFLEYIAKDTNEPIQGNEWTNSDADRYRKGCKVQYVRVCWKDDKQHWLLQKEEGGQIVEEGTFKVSPYIPTRFQAITGESYGRSHVETMIGDIQTLESYTQALIEGMAAASSFWPAVDPSGITEIDDLASAQNGQWVAARQSDVFVISPSATMKSQIDATMRGVEMMRSEVGQAFLLNSASIPKGDRVTATAVRAIGQELEQVLGGVFSSIARELMVPIVRRAMFLMIADGEIDERLSKEFTEDGLLSVDVITGLQALSRDNDLTKLLQMGEMVRNLPPEAASAFKWDAYASSLITALGFDSRNWVKSPEEIQAEQQQAAMAQATAQAAGAVGSAVAQAAGQAAAQDLQNSGGQGIANAASQMGMIS